MNLSTVCGLSTRFFTIILFLLGSGISPAQDNDEEVIIYVNAAESHIILRNMDTYGTSWDTAFSHLHDALRFGDPNATQIWMAEGNYYVDRGANIAYQRLGGSRVGATEERFLNPFFIINRDITIYGGFAGTESSLAERTDPHAHPTYIDGNVYYDESSPIPHPDNLANADNKFAARLMSIYNSTVTLDGLTFQYVRGDRSGGSVSQKSREPNIGKGTFIEAVHSSLAINNCVFQHGAGVVDGMIIYSENMTNPEIRISNTAFRDNWAETDTFFYGEAPLETEIVLEGCVFENNRVADRTSWTSALFEGQGKATISNTVFANNVGLRIIQEAGALTSVDDVADIHISNLLAINNTLDDYLIGLWGGLVGVATMRNTIVNSTFIGNTGGLLVKGSRGSTSSGAEHVLRMHNNLFWNNHTTADGSTATTALTLRGGPTYDISHNASDNSSDILLTDTSHSTGAVDLSAVTDGATLFASHEDPDGSDDLWFTADDGFVPIENSLLHNAGHNDAVTTISADLKGDSRTQHNTVDIGAYEFGEEETVGVEGLSAMKGLVLYPNPLRSRQGKSIVGYLTNPERNPKQLVLRDMSGRLVRRLPITDSKKAIDLGALSSGSYLAILSFADGEQSHSFRVVVE